jgi:hypothetical protein
MVQRRAARFIKSNYSRDPGTVTILLEQLELPPLSTRRKIACITLLTSLSGADKREVRDNREKW